MSGNDQDIYKFTFGADGVATAVWEQDDEGQFDSDSIDWNESYTLYGDAVLHVETDGTRSEWALLVPVTGATDLWQEIVDGHGTLDPLLIPEVLANLGGDPIEDDGEDDDGGYSDDDHIVGGDVYRIVFADDGSLSAIYEIKSDGREELERISPDETYTRVGDYVVKVEADDSGPEWEIYGPVAGSDHWVELADGRGDITLDVETIAALVAAEDGVASNPENDDDDEYRGGEDDDQFSGGEDDDGDDCYIGGAGDDEVAFGGTTGVVVDLSHSGAQDTGRGFDQFIGIENLQGGEGDDDLNGNRHGNGLDGGLGSDDLDGRAGDDSVAGGQGDDSLLGGAGTDSLEGDDGSDDLTGGRGGDTLCGGAGGDDMAGGRGQDTFVFRSDDEIGHGSNHDVIEDFRRGVDELDFSDLALSFIGNGAFTAGGSAELRYEVTETGVNLLGDVDGNGTIDFTLTLNGLRGFSGADAIL